MIFTNKTSLGFYVSSDTSLSKAVDFVRKTDFSALADGRLNIAGDEMYALLTSYPTHTWEGSFESHDRYVDVQFMLKGSEYIFFADRSELKPNSPYDVQHDVTTYEGTGDSCRLLLRPGYAAVFFPSDAHKAGCMTGSSPENVRKLLLRIRYE